MAFGTRVLRACVVMRSAISAVFVISFLFFLFVLVLVGLAYLPQAVGDGLSALGCSGPVVVDSNSIS